MKQSDMVKEAVDCGIKPLTVGYERIKLFDTNKYALRSYLTVNSLELGILNYEQYRYVAARTKQGDELAARHLQKVFRSAKDIVNERLLFVSVPVYLRTVRESGLINLLNELLSLYPELPPEKLCIEISADVLYEDIAELAPRIDELRTLGVKVAINEVGDAFCPVFRLSELSFDYAVCDKYTTDSLLTDGAERTAGSLVSFLNHLKVKTIAAAVPSEEAAQNASKLGFIGFTDALPIDEEVIPNGRP